MRANTRPRLALFLALAFASSSSAMDADPQAAARPPPGSSCSLPPAPFDLGCGAPALPWVNASALLPPLRPPCQPECVEDWGELHYDYLDSSDVTVDVR